MLRLALVLILGFLGSDMLGSFPACGAILSEIHLGQADHIPRAIEITALPAGATQVDLVMLNVSDSTRFGRVTQVISLSAMASHHSLALAHDGLWTGVAWAGAAVAPPWTSHVQPLDDPLDLPDQASGPRSGRAILVYAGDTGLTPTKTNLLDDHASLAHLQSLGLLDAVAIGPAHATRRLTPTDLAALGGDPGHASFQTNLALLDPAQGSSFGRPSSTSGQGLADWLAGTPDATGAIVFDVVRFHFNPAAVNTAMLPNPEPSTGLCCGMLILLGLIRRRPADPGQGLRP